MKKSKEIISDEDFPDFPIIDQEILRKYPTPELYILTDIQIEKLVHYMKKGYFAVFLCSYKGIKNPLFVTNQNNGVHSPGFLIAPDGKKHRVIPESLNIIDQIVFKMEGI